MPLHVDTWCLQDAALAAPARLGSPAGGEGERERENRLTLICESFSAPSCRACRWCRTYMPERRWGVSKRGQGTSAS